MLGKLSNAVSDLTETLRRIFSSPDTHEVNPAITTHGTHRIPPLSVQGFAPVYRFDLQTLGSDLSFTGHLCDGEVRMEGKLQHEAAWASWATGAKVLEMEILEQHRSRGLEIPALPRAAQPRHAEIGSFQTRGRPSFDAFLRPGLRSEGLALPAPRSRRDLELALRVPLAVKGQGIKDLPKAQWMRLGLQLVRSTGENIRNLEVLGLYRIPAKGVLTMKHDGRTDRLMLELGKEAMGAERRPFVLARRKDDRSLVSCFLEEG